MKVLIVGGAGYIGSITACALIEQGADVTVFDNLSTGHHQAVPEDASLVQGDLADSERLNKLFTERSFDTVMHFAASALVGESMERPGLYFANNVANVISLLNVMSEHGVNHFVFSSTAAVYGEPKAMPLSESSQLDPMNPYGESKLTVEKLLRWYGERAGMRYACLRYFNAAGAAYGLGEDHDPETHLIPLTIKVALGQREELVIHGTDYPTSDGTCIRDYVHVLDLARAHIAVMEQLDSGSVVCNLGSQRGYSVREVVEMVRRVSGVRFRVREGDRRPGDPAVLVASSQLAQETLHWLPEHGSLEEIVGSAWEWHSQHPNGYPMSDKQPH